MKFRSKILRYGIQMILLLVLVMLAGSPSQAQTGPCSAGTGVCVLSWQQDSGLSTSCPDCVYNSGENLLEPTLTPTALLTNNFGVLCSAALDGQVFAQPLVATNITINGVTYGRVVYVVTEKDSLYAINGDPTSNPPCQILNGNGNGISLLTSGQYEVDCNHIGGGASACVNAIGPYVGVLSTPVIHISGNGGTIFMVAQTQDCDPQTQCTPQAWGHYLHAVDIQTFADTSLQIYPPGQSAGASTFSHGHAQRPGLLYLTSTQSGLTHDTVYVAFSMMDGAGMPNPNGVIFGYDPANLVQSATPLYFPASLGINQNDGGGIWGGGGAPAFGSNGSQKLIYFTTGNSTEGNTATIHTWHDSFLGLNPDLSVPAGTPYFTPVDQFYRSDASCRPPSGNDRDFGAGPVLLVPDNSLRKWPYMAISGDKEGGVWLMDRTNPGGHNTQCDLPTPTCSCTPSGRNPSGNLQTVWTGAPYSGRGVRNGMAFWNRPFATTSIPYLYVAPQSGILTRFQLCNFSASAAATVPICGGSVQATSSDVFPYGGTPTISAGTPTATDAVVWTTTEGNQAQPIGCASINPQPNCGGTLWAFDAISMNQLYSNHTCIVRDALAPTTKFSVPTVANGNVYIGAHAVDSNGNPTPGGTFYILGLNASTCL